ncbi:MAG: hypothetical protein CMQ29_07145 [Gammaproteobacteria bacterium]|nr:hypothetical protein [Gammaproteobacteria bacterium]
MRRSALDLLYEFDTMTRLARCHCGGVFMEVVAESVDAKICHCQTCQKLQGAPMQWALIFYKQDVRLN